MTESSEQHRDGRVKRTRHEPVLLKQVVELLALGPGQVFVDCTLGGAGHFTAIAPRLAPGGIAIGIDRDALAIKRAQAVIEAVDLSGVGVKLIHASFSELERVVPSVGVDRIDRVLLDLGLSSDQLDDPKRGFSFLRDGPLDMRQNAAQGLTAEEVVNDYSPAELLEILQDYGEERHSQRIVQAIVDERRQAPILSTRQLADIIVRAVPGQRGRTHPATRTFQALRIEVGGEVDEVLEGLPQAARMLSIGGLLAVITFHGLEERLVKDALRPYTRHGDATTNKEWILVRQGGVSKADRDELRRNPRSRSAKLRVFQKVAVEK
jgi:16S rRNA (cytosine1402-N4)-methyltransferase